MDTGSVHQDLQDAAALIERANARLAPAELPASEADSLIKHYSTIERLGGFGVATLSARVEDPEKVARVTGTSIGKARDAIATGGTLQSSPVLKSALEKGAVSLDQATEIARAEAAAPGSASELVKLAKEESFHVLRDQARKMKLEAEQHRDLADRQRAARKARSYSDPLGMVHIHIELEPHVGAPIVSRAEAEAQRLAREAKATRREASVRETGDGPKASGQARTEPFECHLADALAAMLSGAAGKSRPKRPEMVVVVSHGVAKRGWTDVRNGEMCKIPGLGPVAPQVAREIADDAFLNGLFYDGKDLRQLKRWSRDIPVEVRVALELGPPPGFDGIRCRDCGNHFRTQFDHVYPYVARGPTCTSNLEPRCWDCHQAKTARDRRAGRLKPPPHAPPKSRHPLTT